MNVVIFISTALLAALSPPPEAEPHLEVALDTARWLQSQAIHRSTGTTWPAHADEAETVAAHLYGGSSGVVLFFVDAYRISGQLRFRRRAAGGADHLLETISGVREAGLYTGHAGIAYALQETFKITGEEKYRRGFRKCLARIREQARKVEDGYEWNDSTDIISGGAGIGLFLLYAAREIDHPWILSYAEGTARRLLALAEPVDGGVRWAMTPTFPRRMPNFSHGTAGVAYFLATLHSVAPRPEYLAAARGGAEHLLRIARREDDRCLVLHHEPGGEELYYLGWCHGPPGTARLFYQLWRLTEEPRWMGGMQALAQSVLAAEVWEKRTPGFWNNVGQCCGSAGVGEFLLELHRISEDATYLAAARRIADDIRKRGTRTEAGIHWIHAEHRVQPELLKAQTGIMQGAAGIGMFFLHLHNYEKRGELGLVFPDSPFGRMSSTPPRVKSGR